MLEWLVATCKCSGQGFLGYGTVAVQDLPLTLCSPPGVDVFAGFLDPGLEHLPTLSHQSLER